MNQRDHWEFTTDEWGKPYFFELLQLAFPTKKKSSVVYDIGANVGALGSLVMDNFNVRKLISFEPDAENFAYLEASLDDERCVNIDKGIFYGKDTARVMGRGDGNCGGYFVEGLEPFGKGGFDLHKTFSLSPLEIFDLPKPDVIKLDVEGAERNIIEHSEIVKNCPTLIVEWHYEPSAARGFFSEQLPKHKIVKSLEDIMFLLKL